MDDGSAIRARDTGSRAEASGSAAIVAGAIAKPSARRATLLALSDVLWLLAFYHVGASLIFGGAGVAASLAIPAAAAALSLVVFFSLGLYGRDAMYSDAVATQRIAIAGIADFVLFCFALAVLFRLDQGGRAFLGLFLAAMAGHAAAFAARLAIVHRFRLPVMRRAVVVIGCGARAARLRSIVERAMPHEIRILGHVAVAGEEATRHGGQPALELRAGLLEFARETGVDEIVIAADERLGMPMEELLRCKTAGLRVRDDTRFLEEEVGYVDTMTATAGWFVFGGGFARSDAYRVAKRIFDLAVAALALVAAAPLLALAALAIRLEGAGPILFRQERVGLDGRSFTLVKFRSMRVDAEADGPRWAAEGDRRVTRVGRLLRATRLDELPQVLNVLAGSMSFVGPRPERPVFVAQLEGALPFYDERHRVKPGITGWAQINYPYGASFDDAREKLAYDLYYVKNAGLLLDLLILLQTLRVVLFRSGAR